MIHVWLVCCLSIENPWRTSTNLAHAQSAGNCHPKSHSLTLQVSWLSISTLDTRHQHKFMQGAKMLTCRDQMCHGWLVCKTCHPSRIAPEVRIIQVVSCSTGCKQNASKCPQSQQCCISSVPTILAVYYSTNDSCVEDLTSKIESIKLWISF